MTWNRDKKSWRGEAVRHTLACRVLGGEVYKMTWTRDKKAWRGEAVKLRHTLACKVLGGESLNKRTG